jgi:type II secretory pathway component PulF
MFHSREILLWRALADSARAGLSPQATLALLRKRGGLDASWAAFSAKLERGLPVSEALRAHPEAFPAWQTELAAAAEATGRLDEAFDAVALALEQSRSFWLSLLPRLAYPAFLLHFAPAALFAPTLVTCGPAAFLGRVAGLLAPLYLAGFLAWFLLRGPAAMRALKGMPLVSGWAASRFCSMLALLLRAGVAFPRSIELAAAAAGMEAGDARLRSSLGRCLRGDSFVDCLRPLEFLEAGELDALLAAEFAGEYDRELDRVARSLRERNEAVLRSLPALIAPLVYLAVALGVGIMVVRFYGGLFSSLR